MKKSMLPALGNPGYVSIRSHSTGRKIYKPTIDGRSLKAKGYGIMGTGLFKRAQEAYDHAVKVARRYQRIWCNESAAANLAAAQAQAQTQVQAVQAVCAACVSDHWAPAYKDDSGLWLHDPIYPGEETVKCAAGPIFDAAEEEKAGRIE